MSLRAIWYDGRTSAQREVTLYAYGGRLQVEGEGVQRAARLEELQISERLGSAPRQIRFSDGAFCEVRDPDALEPLLQALGHRAAPVERWQRSTRIAVLSAVIAALALVAGYVEGLPWAAQQLADRLPAQVDDALSERTLAALDHVLTPTEVPAARRAQITRGFAGLKTPPGTPALRVRFGGSEMGPNAFALPDGTVVLLDDLVKLCDDEEIYAVLGHELGHVHRRHGLRLLLQGSLAGIAAAWWLGDVSGLLAGAPAALLQARYSRGFEAEADAYAVDFLKRNGLPPSRLADALEKLAAAHGDKGGRGGWIDYLSSHPATDERLRALRAQ